ncbi:hypothetical protein ABFC53_05275 [Stenotrophomonas pavanii]|uniref:hypothetical protein n=1 Tax=Stenotrophomonas TaxID=40323 RepID=UPI000A410792|nr:MULTISPECIES: hypothetical protein [Stenotrophomonas]TGR46385.1 hypothetical protein EN842_26515 [bacterium M00.F.Ca.ET.199.01.1.1]TGT01550.1 hypothetical protein EN820_28680 [bacterium M00.F.Ca.ET.177.01.1.1]TGT59260.1 hypothetical protein EN813_031205 [Mesorhizobium sp. M00.F.Ca.ET.170.01.1.1]TGU10921.1 hypothetical protein EN806_23955 [bacterium M00.F.Ca.ET.163.01.1.1]TGU92558.1 hypothetical protein EN794_033790 [Mesorhizobium sp. M00.F.Ca.ET.151.01.1.1]TGV54885.1 hypothetical protein E
MRSVLLAAIITVSAPAAGAETHVAAGGATPQGSLRVEERSPVIKQLCKTEKVWLSWNKAVPNATLVTCDCSCTSHDNSGWLVEAQPEVDTYRVHRVSLGKVFSPTELRRAGARIQDIVSSHPWCSAARPSVPTNAVFATLVKQPTESGDEPYCFTPHFFVGDPKAPLRRTPVSGELFSDSPAAESAVIAREVKMLRDWRREFAPE